MKQSALSPWAERNTRVLLGIVLLIALRCPGCTDDPLAAEEGPDPDPVPGASVVQIHAGRFASMPRLMASIFTVTTTTDAVSGSLREAIDGCNQAGGACTIRFDIPTSDPNFRAEDGTWTLSYLDTPPSLMVSDVVIDGFTQTESQGDLNPDGPEIILSGNDHTIEYGFSLIQASYVTIRGFIIQGFLYGIQVYGPDSHHNLVQGNYLGLSHDGQDGVGNYIGVEFLSGSHDNQVGGASAEERNLVSGNLHIGIRMSDAGQNIVVGNLVGVDRTGTRAIPNYDGISVEGGSAGNRIGGSAAGERNISSGNVAYGIDIFGAGATGNEVYGNYLGTDVTGTKAIPNTYGILFDDRASDNIVGGLAEGEGNLISGNTAFGGYFYNNGTNGNTIRGNRIGTDATGTKALPNETGVHIDGGTFDNVVDSNLISGNLVAGVTIFALYTDRNIITRNLIGTDATGDLALGNGRDGVRIAFGPRNNRIGGSPDEANVIAHNGRNGVAVESEEALYNTISCNPIYANGNLGIDLFPEGPNPNDPGDGDSGPNSGMNTPIITDVSCAADCTVTGTLDTASPGSATVEVFAGEENATGFVEGRTYLGSVTPSASGAWTFTSDRISSGDLVTATATDSQGSTSEFIFF